MRDKLISRFLCTKSMTGSTKTTKDHYVGHTSKSYESAFFYSGGDYTQNLCEKVLSTLMVDHNTYDSETDSWKSLGKDEKNNFTIKQNDRLRLMDIGGGTGNFTKMMVENTTSMDAVVIDPFLASSDMEQFDILSHHPTNNQIFFVKAGAEEFMEDAKTDKDFEYKPWWKDNYDICLMKEVIHHFSQKDRIPILKGIYSSLLPISNQKKQTSLTGQITPSILIVTRPQKDIDYPLWPEAKEVWALNQPSEEEIMNDLKKAGFEQINCSMNKYECKISLDTWCSMVQNRFWSTFSNFSDQELKDACFYITEKYSKHYENDQTKKEISFEDRLLFIKGQKL